MGKRAIGDYTKFGLDARGIMLKQNISVRELARQLGITDTYLHDIFKGTRVGRKQKPEIVKILGMSEKYLQ